MVWFSASTEICQARSFLVCSMGDGLNFDWLIDRLLRVPSFTVGNVKASVRSEESCCCVLTLIYIVVRFNLKVFLIGMIESGMLWKTIIIWGTHINNNYEKKNKQIKKITIRVKWRKYIYKNNKLLTKIPSLLPSGIQQYSMGHYD